MWFSPHNHSYFSLLDGLSKPSDLAKKSAEYGFPACSLTDHASISGFVDFYKECKKVGIKPICGNELNITNLSATIHEKENRRYNHLVILAKNLQGWKQLLKITSRSNDDDVYYYKARLDLDILSEYLDGNIIGFSGHPGSELANILFENKDCYSGKLLPNAKELAISLAEKYQAIFGKGNFFIEIQLVDKENFPNSIIIADILRDVSKITGIPCIATCDSHYINRKDAEDQRVLLCSMMKTTLRKVNTALANDEDVGLGGFFKSDNFFLPSLEEMKLNHSEEELRNTLLIADMCEQYNILSKPRLPKFECPNNLSEADYLRHLCRQGWVSRLANNNVIKTEEIKQLYGDRVKHELDVIGRANLEGYFLIVQDYVNWAKKQYLVGPGRGSSAGSLVAFLTGITSVDPIPFDLLFSRFYNEGRNTAEHVSLPDIDCDFPKEARDDVIAYLKSKYGEDRVGQIVTFGRLMGRGALKEVLRVHEACDFDTMNRVTKHIPDEAKIADQMESTGHESILDFILEYEPDLVKEYCQKNDDGTLTGEYAQYFEQAIRIEGVYKNQGKHAAGVVISPEPLDELAPMVRDKKGNKIVGLEMDNLEAMGLCKMDVLGVTSFSKLMLVNKLLRGNYV